jgi:hypothetical protein
MILSCLVCLENGAERLIPLAATDLANAHRSGFALPLDLSSLQQLTKIYAQIRQRVEREGRHEGGSDRALTQLRSNLARIIA